MTGLPSESPTSTEVVSPSPITTPAPPPAPTPAPSLSDKQRSNRFWKAATHYGLYGLVYDSLSDITDRVHVVVRGRVTGFADGYFHAYEGLEKIPISVVYVTVDEVLHGEPEMRVSGTIQVADLGWSGMSAADLPTDEVILFLMNEARQRAEGGYQSGDPENERYQYWRPNGYQCVLRNVDGRVDVVQDGFSGYPLDLEGKSFETVVQRIRELVESP